MDFGNERTALIHEWQVVEVMEIKLTETAARLRMASAGRWKETVSDNPVGTVVPQGEKELPDCRRFSENSWESFTTVRGTTT